MSETQVRVRFAPSPTGMLHIGGARTALYNWLYARHMGGTFVLRVEDTDEARNTPEAREAIFSGLRWLGLDWDEGPDKGGDFGPYFQSERKDIYAQYLKKLEDAGLAYEDEGAVRFRVPDKPITVDDVVCGSQTVNLAEQGSRKWDPEQKKEVEANPDLVIRRPDGTYIFHFANVVDDLTMGITHVIRGEDHLSNTPKHMALFEAFGATPPRFVHIPLNLNADGSKMSKRDQGAAVAEYMNGGFLPQAVCNYIALLGWSSKDDQEIFTMAELKERFTLEGVNRSNSRFDFSKCVWMNAEHLRRLTPGGFAELAIPYVEKAGIQAESEERLHDALALVQERTQLLTEVPEKIGYIFSDDYPKDEAALSKAAGRDGVKEAVTAMRDFLAKLEDAWTGEAIHDAIFEAASSLGLKPGALMFPCRAATTGQASGAELMPVLELMGQKRVLQRLDAFLATL